MRSLSGADLLVIGGYLLAVVAMSAAVAWRQRTGEEYFLAGRRMRGWPLALSIVANQASAVSLVGAPAFVALQPGGGLVWLQYELALPLAMLALLVLLLPALRRVPGASIYAMLDDAFGRPTRRTVAVAFLLSRGLALGVVLYASALVVAVALDWPLTGAIVLLGGVAVAYTSLGGLAADIWSDVLQLAVLWVGCAAATWCLWAEHGAALVAAVPPERLAALAPRATGLGDGATFGLLPMLVGGLFLYASYYGCDQSQAQRLLAARDDRDAARALVLNGLLRFPLVLTYCAFGVLLAGLLRLDAGFAATMAGRPADSLVPTYLVSALPSGLRGLLLAAILAAAMSSIDSALNSLAAITLEDVAGIPPGRQSVWLARGTTFAWGVFAVLGGLAAAQSGRGILELVNQVGSLFFGPVLGVFLLARLAPAAGGRAALSGLAAGLGANALVAAWATGIAWLWWNPFGCAATVGTALLLGRVRPRLGKVTWPGRAAWALVAAFVAVGGLLIWLGSAPPA